MSIQTKEPPFKWGDFGSTLLAGVIVASTAGLCWIGINDRVASLTGIAELAQVSFWEFWGASWCFASLAAFLRVRPFKVLMVDGKVG
jgi:hypothetical protein